MIRILKSCSSRFRCAIALGFVAFVGLGCSVWSASASAFTTTYDSLNRVTSVVYSPTQRIDYVYDAAGNLIEERVNGAAGLTVTAQASPAAGGSVTISPAQSSFVAGDVITITATPASGYNFTGWSGVAGCTAATSCTFTVGSSSITALANFSAVVVSGLRTLRAFAVPAVGGTITPTPNPAGYAPGTVLSFNASAIAPYEIDQWYGAGCPYLGGPTANVCSFAMPSSDADILVSFKQPGSGRALTVNYRGLSGVPAYNPLAAGMVEVTPAQQRIPAGSSVTLKFRVAKGYRFDGVDFVLQPSGVADTSSCTSVRYSGWVGGQEPSCTFVMPDSDLELQPLYVPDPVKYLVDVSPVPAAGGSVTFAASDAGLPSQIQTTGYYDLPSIATRRSAMAGLQIALTAKPVGAREFIRWQNGPCANSTNPVCMFTMPSSNVVSVPVFSDEPTAQCTYSLSMPSMAFPGIGGTRSITVITQAGCNFNVETFTDGYGSITVTRSGNVVDVALPANTYNFAVRVIVRIHGGSQAFTVPVIQAGNNSNSVATLPLVTLPSAVAGSLPTVPTRITVTNNTAITQPVASVYATSAFAVAATTCPGLLAVGASCTADILFAPNRTGVFNGEVIVLAREHLWSVPVQATASGERTNVAARANGGNVFASDRFDIVNYNESALIEGDRRYVSDRSIWMSNNGSSQQSVESRFAQASQIEWIYLFGWPSGNETTYEPRPSMTSPYDRLNGFTIKYWTGTQWLPVTELERVDGTNVWRRVRIQPVSTDRIRVDMPIITSGQLIASELEVWTTTADVVPDALNFAPAIDVPLSTTIQSGAITPVGYSASTSISITGGAYSIGCNGVFTTATGTLQPGQSVCVRHTSAATGGTMVTTTLTIGGVAGTFSSTTQSVIVLPPDVTPDPIASQSILDVAIGATVYFTPFSVTGINAAATLTVGGVGGLEVSVGCTGAYSSTPGSVTNGESVCVRHVAANTALTNVVSSLAVGTVTVTFTSRTGAPPLTCSLDVDAGSGATAEVDGVIISRYLLGFRGDALVAGLAPLGTRNTGALIQSFLGTAAQFDVVGRAVPAPTAHVDGLILMRLMQGFPDSALLTGITMPAGSQFTTASQVRANVNSKCGTTFVGQPSVLSDDFNGVALNTAVWTEVRGGTGVASVTGGTVTFPSLTSANTQGKVTMSGSKIVIEGRFTGLGPARDTSFSLIDTATGDYLIVGDTSYSAYGFYSTGTGQLAIPQVNMAGTTSAYKEYRLTIDGTNVRVERGDTLATLTELRTATLPASIVGKTFYLKISTAGPSFSPGTFDWIRARIF